MSYLFGLIKYVIKSPIKNFVPMYLFGGGVRALFEALVAGADSGFIAATLQYFVTKYLPPTSLGQIIVQVLMGSVVAGAIWYMKTPRY